MGQEPKILEGQFQGGGDAGCRRVSSSHARMRVAARQGGLLFLLVDVRERKTAHGAATDLFVKLQNSEEQLWEQVGCSVNSSVQAHEMFLASDHTSFGLYRFRG